MPVAPTSRCGPEHPVREAEDVGAEIQHRTAGLRRVHHPPVPGEVLAVVGHHGLDLTEHPVSRTCRMTSNLGSAVVQNASMQNTPAIGGQRGQLARLRRVDRQRLLHQHGLAGHHGGPGAVQVRDVLGGDVDHVDPVAVDHLLVAAVGGGNPEAIGERGGPVQAAGRDRDDLLRGRCLQCGDEPLGDPAGADDAPAQRGCRQRIGDARGGQCAGHRTSAETRTVRPPLRMEAMTAVATALACSPSAAVASVVGVPAVSPSTQACSSRR